MARKIASGNVPKWFNISKFDYLKDLGAPGWAKVLRVLLPTASYSVESLLEDFADEGMTRLEVANEFFADFLAYSPEGPLWEERWGPVYLRRFPEVPERFQFRSVSSLSVEVVAYMAALTSRLDHGLSELQLQKWRLKAQNGESGRAPKSVEAYLKSDERQEFAERPFFLAVRESPLKGDGAESLTANRAISVNMSLPDEMILEDFKEWLRAVRLLKFHAAAPKKFKPEDFARWVDGRYVPLLILDRWQEWSGARITYPELVSSLFPTRTMITHDHVRRTHLPQARAWLCEENLLALEAQATKEAG